MKPSYLYNGNLYTWYNDFILKWAPVDMAHYLKYPKGESERFSCRSGDIFPSTITAFRDSQLNIHGQKVKLNAVQSFYTTWSIFSEILTLEWPKFYLWSDMLHANHLLTHWGWDKMAAISQTAFSNAFLKWKCMNCDQDFTEFCS